MPSEFAALAAAIEAGNAPLPPYLGKLIQNAQESFDDPRAGQIAVTVLSMRNAGEPINFASIGEKHPALLPFISTELVSAGLPLDSAEWHAEECWKSFQSRKAMTVFAEAQAALKAAPNQAQAIITTACVALDAVTNESSSLIDRLAARIYSPSVKPAEPTPRYSIANTPISSPGNLTTISAQAKAGKTAAINAMLASTFAAPDADCLGFTSQNPKGLAVVHIDTEQCLFDHWQGVERALRRSKIDNAPPWLRSYCLTGFSANDVRASIRILIEQAAKLFNGVHSVFIDGVADVTPDVNDPAETSSLIAELHKLAVEFDCPILNIIHVNPGSDSKTRGHLGSQLERKSETNLRLEKAGDGVTVIFADKNRRAPIPKIPHPGLRGAIKPECTSRYRASRPQRMTSSVKPSRSL